MCYIIFFLNLLNFSQDDKTRWPFIINTKRQGNVYHQINAFEFQGEIVVDAFVSKLNSARESAQFELGEKPVFDNEGDPFRFVIKPPTKDYPQGGRMRSKVKGVFIFCDISSNFFFFFCLSWCQTFWIRPLISTASIPVL
jgi:hypothetical protein